MPSKQVSIPGVEKRRFTVTMEGTTPLLCHRFSDEAKKSILDKQMKRASATKAKAPKDPEQLYRGSMYQTEEGKPGFPAGAIKKACISAGRFLDVAMTHVRGAFFVMGDILPLTGEPRMHMHHVRIGGKVADIRFRAEFPEWSIDLDILYNPDVISEEGIVNILETAGFHIGIGDWRPERNGTFGMFQVQRKG